VDHSASGPSGHALAEATNAAAVLHNAGDVDVGPVGARHELLEESSRRAGPPLAGHLAQVVHIRVAAVRDLVVVLL